ncbi:MAG: hypothetical protein RBT80_05300 [Candidatus Vecturithrix sp.]|jgi:hypothetical protein|nr:hypothetical protein [Candidatus Vecturithrix sp.]
MSEFLVSKLSEFFGQNEYLFVYDVISFLGWLNVVLVLIVVSLFTFRRINRYIFANQQPFLKKLNKPLSKIHPYIGFLLIISAYIHGDLALGSMFRIHTGPVAWWILIVMMLVALIGKKYRIKQWLTVHRTLAAFFIVFIVLHLFARNILG